MAQYNTVLRCFNFLVLSVLIFQQVQCQPPFLGSTTSCGKWCNVHDTAGRLVHTYHHCQGHCSSCAGEGYKVAHPSNTQIAPGKKVAAGIYIYRQCIHKKKCKGILWWRRCS